MAVTKRKHKKAIPGRPTVFYEAEVFVAGVRVANQCFETHGAAEAWHDKTKRRFESGRGPGGEMTLAEVMTRYREVELPGLVEGTRRKVRIKLDFLAESPTARVAMSKFNGSAVDALLAWLIAHPRADTPTRTSFVNELKQLQVILNFYRESFDEAFVSPVTKRHRRRAMFRGAVQEKRAQDFYLSAADAMKWFAELRKCPNPIYLDIAQIQVVLGLRIGEAASLLWEAVDFDGKLIKIKRTMFWVTGEGKRVRDIGERTKTSTSRRTLPMPPMVERVLLNARSRHPDSLVVFRNPNGSLIRYGTVLHAFNEAFKRAGLPWSGTNICRHTNATLGLKEAGAQAVQVNLGHSTARQTEAYAKVRAIAENKVPEMVAQLFENPKAEKSRIKSRIGPAKTEKSPECREA